MIARRTLLVALPGLAAPRWSRAAGLPAPLRGEEAEPALRALRRGGHALLFRHADTRGMACDTTADWRDAERQRHLSPAGRAQARALGEALREWRVPIASPVLASPVPRALDTAVLAFGQAEADERLLSDEFARDRFEAVMAAQRALLAEDVPPGANRVLVGHLSSAVRVGDRRPTQAEFPEASAMVFRAGRVVAVLELAPIPGGGAHACR
jgi:phosphohistidine phosphatase SixA